MGEVLDRICQTREQAHAAVTDGYTHAKAILRTGKPARVVVHTHEEDRTVQANRWYWGVMLREISEQAAIEGQRYTVDAWHELGKRQFLGFEIKKVRVAGKKKPVVIRRLKSTTNLKIRAFSEYLEKFQAFAATDLGVRFSAPDWQEWQA